MSFPMSIVIVQYTGAGPNEIESMVSKPMETVLSTTKDLKNITSYSIEGMSAIMLEFDWDKNMDFASLDIREKIDMVRSRLPDGTENPMIVKFDPSMMPVLMLSVTSKTRKLSDLRYFAEEVIQPRLERLNGVAAATPNGGLTREIHVKINRSALESRGLSLQQVTGMIGAANLTLPGGHIRTQSSDFIVRTIGQFSKVDEFKNVVISNQGGTPVYLRDIAVVEDSFEEKTSEVRVNGSPSVMVQVQKASRTNTVQVADTVKKALKLIQKELPDDITLEIIMDSSMYIKQSINQVQKSALEGAFLSIIIILLFLRSISSTLLVSTAIPLSVITAFILMYFGKMNLNMATLGGLALGIGRLVDDAIVVIESIYRHRKAGESLEDAAVNGTSEVALAVLASTITTISVFVPILFVTGMAGIMFKPMAYTVAFSLAASYFVAMLLIPVLASKLIKMHVLEEKPRFDVYGRITVWESLKTGYWLNKLDETYQNILKWALAHKKKVVMIVLIAFVSMFPLIPFIGTEFIPESDQGEFVIYLKMPVGTKLEKTLDVITEIETIIKKDVPETESVTSRIGVEGKGFGAIAAVFTGISGAHGASIRIQLVSLSKRNRSQNQVIELLRNKFKDIPDADIRFSASGFMGGFGSGDPINVEIRGYDIAMSRRLSDKIMEIAKTVPGIRDLKVSREEGLPELQIEINREKAASLGLNVAQISQTIQNNIDGKIASLYRDPALGKEYSVVVQLDEKYRDKLVDLGRVFITSPLGKQIPLSNIASIRKGTGPVKIDRKNQERIVSVTAQVFGRPAGTIAAELESKLKKELVVPSNFIVQVTGNYTEQVDAFKNLLFALLLAVGLVYMVLASQFESFLSPFIIMFSVPLGIIGVIWGLFFTGSSLNVLSFLGIIMMAGIVVSNGILLVDYTNVLIEGGMEFEKAIVTAGRTRLRPVLMTTLTTITGMVPLALGIGEGAELSQPMAVAVVFGLTVSTVLTLIFIPVLYGSFVKRKMI
jgi:HAE1 family hydrophobic/amphiphilic exporter-1